MEILQTEGKFVKINSGSITCKGENGKTCGIVKNITKFLDLQANKQFLFSKALRDCGLWGSKYDLMKNVVYCDGSLYHFLPIDRLEHLKKYDEDKYNDLTNIAKSAERSGIYTILCYM